MSQDAGAYLHAVETQYLALRGSAYALSAKDVGKVLAWHAEGVPLRLVLRELEAHMEKWRADGGRRVPSLSHLERAVRAAMRQRGERLAEPVVGGLAAGGPEAPDTGWMWGALETAVAGVTLEGGEASLVALREGIGVARAAGESAWDVAERLNEALVTLAWEWMGEDERRRLRERLEASIQAQMPQASPAVWREQLDWRIAAEMRELYGLPDLKARLLAGGGER